MKRSGGRDTLALGIMSGTSADGIDVALVRMRGRRTTLENFAAFPFSPRVQKAILSLGEGRRASTLEISQLNFLLGETFADAALGACKKFRVAPSKVDVIGSHGQTVFHQGMPAPFLGRRIASTLQIGDPSVIAVRTGITTVGDFRPADMAAGGQGAPLVPFVDFLLYEHPRIGRAALNIGGIANLTIIPSGGNRDHVFAFDTGPGNMAIDALVRHFTGGKKSYDRNAEMAGRGTVLPGLRDELLREKYFFRHPPKSTGREHYGEGYVRKILSYREARPVNPVDLIRTLTVVTALSIVEAFRRFVFPCAEVKELIVSGGGARNPLLMASLEAGFKNKLHLRDSAEFGVPGHAKEAFAFAVLACETLRRQPGNVPAATGAKKPVILGKVCYAR